MRYVEFEKYCNCLQVFCLPVTPASLTPGGHDHYGNQYPLSGWCFVLFPHAAVILRTKREVGALVSPPAYTRGTRGLGRLTTGQAQKLPRSQCPTITLWFSRNFLGSWMQPLLFLHCGQQFLAGRAPATPTALGVPIATVGFRWSGAGDGGKGHSMMCLLTLQLMVFVVSWMNQWLTGSTVLLRSCSMCYFSQRNIFKDLSYLTSWSLVSSTGQWTPQDTSLIETLRSLKR